MDDLLAFGREIIAHLKSEWLVLTGAPIAVILIFALIFLAVWYAVNYHYVHELGGRDSALRGKDATIEHLNERVRLRDDRVRDLQQEKDTMVRQLSQVARQEPDELVAQITQLRAELDERKRREWQLLTKEQEGQLRTAIQRSGSEEAGERMISLLVEETAPGAFDFAAQLLSIFRKAGWEQSQFGEKHLWTDVAAGITVGGPSSHPGADFLTGQLAKLVGEHFVKRKIILSPFPSILDRAFVVQITIGRKPLILSQNQG
jgi:hypothetical protein